MAKFELKKSVEATKLNKRTWIPTTEPPVTIPFGALIEDLREDGDYGKFLYLGQPYRCPLDILQPALAKLAAPAPTPAPALAPAAEAPAEAAKTLRWEPLVSTDGPATRAKVPGGWLVRVNGALAFYPDHNHQWDGASLP